MEAVLFKNAHKMAIGLLITILCMSACSCHFPPKYTAKEIAHFKAQETLIEIIYNTRAGRQVAYYVFPSLNPNMPPTRLVIAYPGIGSRALDWMSIINQAPKSSVGFLLIDYPGCGANEGMIRPKDLYESSLGAIKALNQHFKGVQCKKINVLGHSFGCAAALQFSSKYKVEKIVLIAPFTTLYEIVYEKAGLIAWLIPDKMDNGEYLKELYNRIPRPEVTIIHGNRDQIVPVTMGCELFNLFPSWIHYHEIPGAGHTDVIQKTEGIFFQILLF